jgi:dienelactone hydrolase
MTTDRTAAPYGTWKSPLRAEDVASVSTYSMHWIAQLYTDRGDLYALRMHSEEGGRGVVTRVHDDGRVESLTPAPFSCRTRVYEYGGGCFAVQDGVIYFSNVPDDRLYRHVPGALPEPITTAGEMRYSDLVMDAERGRILCVREDRRGKGEHRHTIAAITMDGDEYGTVLFDQTDFVANPSLSPDGTRLLWFAWNHPNMRFYISGLWLADIADDGSLTNIQQLVPEQDEAILAVGWSPEGDPVFGSDRDNWWNLYRWRAGEITRLAPMEAEIDRPFCGVTAGDSPGIVTIYRHNGRRHIGVVNTTTGRLRELPTQYTFFAHMAVAGEFAYTVAASPTVPLRVIQLNVTTGAHRVLIQATSQKHLNGYISSPEHIEFPTEGGQTAHANYYPPINRDYVALTNEQPPLIVNVHGGPTSSANMGFNLAIQFWTSRGFAYLDVDYGGSTGYGRAYRQRLWENWGVVDVDDAINAARYLVQRGLADGRRTIIRGGSAGGFTTLAALAFRDYFRVGSCHFGISDLEAFHNETHKYESHYCETLIGPYPQLRDRYMARSPITRADAIRVPLILFQGMQDKVVLPNQSQFVAEALRARNVPVVYIEFEDEAHGFTRAVTNIITHQAELAFFGQVFDFEPADELPEIENLLR